MLKLGEQICQHSWSICPCLAQGILLILNKYCYSAVILLLIFARNSSLIALIFGKCDISFGLQKQFSFLLVL